MAGRQGPADSLGGRRIGLRPLQDVEILADDFVGMIARGEGEGGIYVGNWIFRRGCISQDHAARGGFGGQAQQIVFAPEAVKGRFAEEALRSRKTGQMPLLPGRRSGGGRIDIVFLAWPQSASLSGLRIMEGRVTSASSLNI